MQDQTSNIKEDDGKKVASKSNMLTPQKAELIMQDQISNTENDANKTSVNRKSNLAKELRKNLARRKNAILQRQI